MARYFMGDTRLESLERMMMDPSRRPPSPSRPRPRQKGPQRKTARSQPAKLPVPRQTVGEEIV